LAKLFAANVKTSSSSSDHYRSHHPMIRRLHIVKWESLFGVSSHAQNLPSTLCGFDHRNHLGDHRCSVSMLKVPQSFNIRQIKLISVTTTINNFANFLPMGANISDVCRAGPHHSTHSPQWHIRLASGPIHRSVINFFWNVRQINEAPDFVGLLPTPP
jgi:hypothetical protein